MDDSVNQDSFGSGIQSDSLTFSNGGASSTSATAAREPVEGNVLRRNFRKEVCRHWIRGNCKKGDDCRFLHQYVKDRFPVCKYFKLYGKCSEQDCLFKHTNEDIKECNMYKLGFCLNGPDCRCRQVKMPGPPPPIEEVLQKMQHLYSDNDNTSNKSFQQQGVAYPQQVENSKFPQGPNS
ncbi:30-kDa cleavage and polyadenylation specificity factor 30 [Quillaja saponaria]|uniref:30-kDa cleavage and polyadenylation specificity factor 30 n=1 Tax=Quillaja saponaria TaxID=32244 RepID=A0AAD7PV83_QUISA|nr:30-kDa cleavage and polyadenylation specificity factor 30 [Quillaja saponaria]